MRTQGNNQNGFSLLEALIVMSIIVAMTAAVIPNHQLFDSKLSAVCLSTGDRQPIAVGSAASRPWQRDVHVH